MKEFILLFRFSPSLGLKNKENSWENWIGGLIGAGKFVTMHQFGEQSMLISKDKIAKNELYFNNENEFVSGYVIIKEESLDAASEIAKESPILELQGNIEVRNLINH